MKFRERKNHKAYASHANDYSGRDDGSSDHLRRNSAETPAIDPRQVDCRGLGIGCLVHPAHHGLVQPNVGRLTTRAEPLLVDRVRITSRWFFHGQLSIVSIVLCSRGEALADQLFGAGDARLDRAKRNALDLRRVGVAELLNLDQHKCRSLL